MTESEIRDMLLKACQEAGSRQAWVKARREHTSVSTVQRFLGGASPEPKLLAAMGLRRVVVYERIEE